MKGGKSSNPLSKELFLIVTHQNVTSINRIKGVNLNSGRRHCFRPFPCCIMTPCDQTARRNVMSVIGIIGAMEEEVAALKEKMQISGVLKRASMEFYKGT